VSLGPDRRTLAVGAGNQPVTIWNLVSGIKEKSYQANSRSVQEIMFTPDGQCLILRFEDPRVRVWRFHDGPDAFRKLVGHKKEAWSLAFSPDGTLLASGADDHTIKLWDVETGHEMLTFRGHDQTVTSLAFFPDGHRLASVSLDGSVRIWNLTREGRDPGLLSARSTELAHYSEKLRALAIAPDGQRLAVAGSRSQGKIHVWDLRKSDVSFELTGHGHSVFALAYSPDSSLLASASEDQTVGLWDTKTGELCDMKPLDACLRTVAFSTDGQLLAAGGDPRVVTIWSMNDQHVHTKLIGQNPLPVRSVAFSRDDLTIATACDDDKVRLWDAATGQYFFALLGHKAQINAVAFSPNGRALASCDHQGVIHFWKISGPPASPEMARH
jgi:WD40 repeat protein